MPRVPKWMANAMESLFSGSYHPVQITAVSYLADHFKKVRFEGDFSKLSKPFIPGNVIEFRVTDTEFRHYTPSFFDMEKGVCEVLFYLHGKGPGSAWAERIRVGDTTKLLGPGGKIRFNGQATRHLCFGDETSLGLLKCLYDEALKRNHLCQCIAELDPAHAEWPGLLELKCINVEKDGFTGDREVIDKIGQDLQDTAFYLTGNAKSIQTIRKYLTEKGVPGKQIHTEPYWSEGKPGL